MLAEHDGDVALAPGGARAQRRERHPLERACPEQVRVVQKAARRAAPTEEHQARVVGRCERVAAPRRRRRAARDGAAPPNQRRIAGVQERVRAAPQRATRVLATRQVDGAAHAAHCMVGERARRGAGRQLEQPLTLRRVEAVEIGVRIRREARTAVDVDKVPDRAQCAPDAWRWPVDGRAPRRHERPRGGVVRPPV